MDENAKKSERKIFKSPRRKLITFFEKSRDKWKNKCKSAKYENKLLKNKNRYLEKRKKELIEKVKGLETKLAQIEVKKNQK